MRKGDLVVRERLDGEKSFGVVIRIYKEKMFADWAVITMVEVITLNGHCTWVQTDLKVLSGESYEQKESDKRD